MKINGRFLLLALIFASTACAQGISDSAFRVSGEVVNQRGEPINECFMDVVSQDSSEVEYTQKIDSKFKNTFTIEPGAHKFHLVIRCNSAKKPYRTGLIEIRGSERYENPILLGVIELSTK